MATSHSVRDVETQATLLRAVIVDDEPLARDCMRLALEGSEVKVVAECADGEAAVEAILTQAPDVVLLDVQMPGLDGFGVIERVGPESMPPVVFVTAFDAHAIRAFDVQALDYVLKPFEDARLQSAVDRVREFVRDRRSGELARRLTALMREWYGEPGAPRPAVGRGITRFTVRHDGRVHFVPVASVDWIESDGNYIVLHVGTAQHRIRAALNQVADELDATRFVRVHRSAIVNVERIREVQRWFGGDYIAIMHDGTRLRVSRLRAGDLLRPMT